MLMRTVIAAFLAAGSACGGSQTETTAPSEAGTAGPSEPSDGLGPSTPPGGNPGEGTLNGKVTFVGKPCPQPSGPPCDGPYPGYEVVVYAADGTTEVARTRTGADGSFDLSLKEGDYAIFTQAGPAEKDRARTDVHVGRDALAQVALRVDTGVR